LLAALEARTPAPDRAWKRAALAAIALACAVGIGIVWRAGMTRPPPPAVEAAAPASHRPVTIVDLPVPSSTSEEAIAAYRRGLVAERSGDTAECLKAFLEVNKLDPDMAAGWLRAAFNLYVTGNVETAREALAKAGRLQNKLSDHDRALLGICEPLIVRDPADWDEALTRFRAAVERFPD